MNINELINLGRQDKAAAYRAVCNLVPEASRRNFFEFRGRQSCIREAMSKPLPGAAGDAVISKEMTVSGRKVYRIFPSHILALQAVDSPLLKMAQDAASSNDGKSNMDFKEHEQWELCYIITENPRSLREKLEKFGADSIRQAACEAIDGVWDAAEIRVTVIAAISQYAKHIQTNIKLAGEAAKDDRFFRELLEKVSKQPESDGS